MQVRTLLIDLDDTLYPPQTGLWEAIRGRMHTYMVERMGMSDTQANHLRPHFLETYGTTLRGLQSEFEVDAEEFLAYVHDLPLVEYLQPNEAVRQTLLSLPQRRWVFTNADQAHATRVLKVLQLEECFDGIIDVRALGFLNKPDPQAFWKALELAGENDPHRTLFMDDALRNLLPARQLGLITLLVNPFVEQNGVDYHIHYLTDLRQALPGLWESLPAYQKKGANDESSNPAMKG